MSTSNNLSSNGHFENLDDYQHVYGTYPEEAAVHTHPNETNVYEFFQDQGPPYEQALYEDYGRNYDYAEVQAETKVVDPADGILIIAENFVTLRSGVPDADNRFLWSLAKDFLKKEDSVTDYVQDLIQTGDYPVEGVNVLQDEANDDEFNAAMKYFSLRSILPEASAAYLWKNAREHAISNDYDFNQLVIHLQETRDYPTATLSELAPEVRIELKKQEFTRNAQKILHTIDSQYIEEQLNTETAMGYNEEGVGQLILDCMSKMCPSKTEEYYRKITQEAKAQYSNDFDVEKFLQLFPEPVKYFENPTNAGGPKYRADVFKYLRAVLRPHVVTNERIRRTLKSEVFLIRCYRIFFKNSVSTSTIHYNLTDECGRFINELTYIRFYDIIRSTAAIHTSLNEVQNAISVPLLYTDGVFNCDICEELVPRVLQCSEAHIFCIECVRGWVNERLKNGYAVVNCLQVCAGTLYDEDLSHVLPHATLDKLKKRRQDQDVGAAKIDGIQNCPWCDYRYVPRPEDMDLVCLNRLCGERWCQKCRLLAHYPEPCEDTPDEVKKRVYIEERMTQAAVKICPNCNKDVVKDGGCDLVSCNCGTRFCYKCGQRATHHDCNMGIVARDVHTEGLKAKIDAERLFPGVLLNHDPTQLK